MIQRVVLYSLLAAVAGAAAVLSFAALRDLALLCGFDSQLAWLLPIVVDAGAAAGSLAWLGTAAPGARSYGRVLALVMLASSVAGNALAHGLAAYGVRPHWLVVVGVSAIAPAVVFAMVHLLVLVGRPLHVDPAETWEEKRERLLGEGVGRRRLMSELDISEWEARQLLQARQA